MKEEARIKQQIKQITAAIKRNKRIVVLETSPHLKDQARCRIKILKTKKMTLERKLGT